MKGRFIEQELLHAIKSYVFSQKNGQCGKMSLMTLKPDITEFGEVAHILGATLFSGRAKDVSSLCRPDAWLVDLIGSNAIAFPPFQPFCHF